MDNFDTRSPGTPRCRAGSRRRWGGFIAAGRAGTGDVSRVPGAEPDPPLPHGSAAGARDSNGLRRLSAVLQASGTRHTIHL